MRVKVKAIPSAKEDSVLELPDGSLKVKLTAPPERGKANKKLIEILSKYFGVNKKAVTIVSGHKSREKLVEIAKS